MISSPIECKRICPILCVPAPGTVPDTWQMLHKYLLLDAYTTVVSESMALKGSKEHILLFCLLSPFCLSLLGVKSCSPRAGGLKADGPVWKQLAIGEGPSNFLSKALSFCLTTAHWDICLKVLAKYKVAGWCLDNPYSQRFCTLLKGGIKPRLLGLPGQSTCYAFQLTSVAHLL